MSNRVLPTATYRVQMTARPGEEFTFDRAAAILDYLSKLGVSHLYCSPYLKSGHGSEHGYDVIKHQEINPELGGGDGHRRLCAALQEHHMGQVLDLVPNHMAILGGDNELWWDVLENGRSSRFASYFDIDWDDPNPKQKGKMLLPILGDHYGYELEAGKFTLERDSASFRVRYHGHVMPIAPETLKLILAPAAENSGSISLAFLGRALGNLPDGGDRETITTRHQDKGVLLSHLAEVLREEPSTAAAVDDIIAQINTEPQMMDRLFERQHWRPAFWRTAATELNYRRFFNINTLVGMRVEDEQVFIYTHALILRWVKDCLLDGLRVDHIDGLRDPLEYLRRLRRAAPDAWIITEKILDPSERLPENWPVDGTTGYDFMHKVNGIFIDTSSEKALTDFYSDFTGEMTDYREIVRRKKHLVLRRSFGGELNRLTNLLTDITRLHWYHRDHSRIDLLKAVTEIIACFPVYRTYMRGETHEIREEDERYIKEAVEAAKSHHPHTDPRLWQFIRDLLLLRITGELETDFVMKFQQFTAPAMAKGVEDTPFYSFNRLVSLNEVGGDPGIFGLSAESFHAYCAEMQNKWPLTMTATATHDTKRSEDVRLRIDMISEMPQEWIAAVTRWAKMNARHRSELLDRNTEYLFYQTLFGAWPLSQKRLQGYMLKAAHEAKTHTSWTYPDPEYEKVLWEFIRATIMDKDFLADFLEFLSPAILPARISSLSQTLIKCTAPGVPDFYQGTELWDLSLVDPDNRRAVDYELRRKLLDEMESLSHEQVLARMDDGLPKLFVTARALRLRRDMPGLFGAEGDYAPLYAEGEKAHHLVAFIRGGRAITLAPRLVFRLGDWGETCVMLPEGKWRNIFTNAQYQLKVNVSEILNPFPVGLLVKESEAE